MLKTITPTEMKRIEQRVMQHTSVTGEMLMQNAASHVAQAVRELCPQNGTVVCICGCGNNGGDGLAAVRMLSQEGYRCECWLLPGSPSADWQREYRRLCEAAPQVRIRKAKEAVDIRPDCAVDAMFGTGLVRPLEGNAREMCRRLRVWRAAGVPVVAVDIPSGLHGQNGQALGEAVRATRTVTFHRPKQGLYLADGLDHSGEIVIAPIGLPVEWDDADGCTVLERKDFNRLLPPRKHNTHKGSYGKVLLLAGSRGMAGAAALAATAALRTGAGLVTVACPDVIVDTVQMLCPCATCLPLSLDVQEAWRVLEDKFTWADALAVGCGLGTGDWAHELMNRLTAWLNAHDLPTVMDADALNLVAVQPSKPARVFVTPHPAEAARLLQTDVPSLLADPIPAAQKLADRYGAAVLKGACSVLCAQNGLALNPYGTPAMAKGGSGDVLTGVMVALLAGRAAGAYCMTDLETMQVACALHGLAGEKTASLCGERGVLATDLCRQLGQSFDEKSERSMTKGDHTASLPSTLGRRVTVIVEHKRGQKENGMTWNCNCGYVQEVLSEQNLWQDACIIGACEPLEWFEGQVVARVSANGRETWIVADEGVAIPLQTLLQQVSFLGDVTLLDAI